jgi:aspartyl-tRNA(Asn)/glutamyl-tRNA(Gln) amidotransferase subunit C
LSDDRPELGPDDVLRIADLARLRIDPAEVSALVEHFSRMLRFVDHLAEADDPSLDPWRLDTVATEALRPDQPRSADEPGAPVPPEVWQGNAPESDGPYFTVPRVIG